MIARSSPEIARDQFDQVRPEQKEV